METADDNFYVNKASSVEFSSYAITITNLYIIPITKPTGELKMCETVDVMSAIHSNDY